MSAVAASTPPPAALLRRYASTGAYTDCYVVTLPGEVSLAQFIGAFYTTPVFRLERWLLARLLGFPSTDQDAATLARGGSERFAAWRVEDRRPDQALLAAGRTRSWLMACPGPPGAGTTALYFGSAVLPGRGGGLGGWFAALLGFHRLYSRVLLASAARRLRRAGG